MEKDAGGDSMEVEKKTCNQVVESVYHLFSYRVYGDDKSFTKVTRHRDNWANGLCHKHTHVPVAELIMCKATESCYEQRRCNPKD